MIGWALYSAGAALIAGGIIISESVAGGLTFLGSALIAAAFVWAITNN